MIYTKFQDKMIAERDKQEAQYKTMLCRLNLAHTEVKNGVGNAQVAAFLSAFGVNEINDLTEKQVPEFLEHADSINWFYVAKLHNRSILLKYVHSRFLSNDRPIPTGPEGLAGNTRPDSHKRKEEHISIDAAKEAMDRLHQLAGDCTLAFMFDPDYFAPAAKDTQLLH